MLCVFSVAAQQWRAEVDRLMDCGEFARASAYMKSLPKGVRQADAVQIDSLNQIMTRIRKDFNITPEDGRKMIAERVPDVTDEQIARWKEKRQLEVMNIDGREWWFRKAIRNLWLLGDEFSATEERQDDGYQRNHKYYLEAMQCPADVNGVRDWRKVNITFTLDVHADVIPAGETLRVWMPLPYENMRQRNIRFISGNHPVTFSEGSKHHTVYMEAVAVKGQPTHFEYTFCYDVAERHLCQQDVLALLKPYDTESETYRRFTASEAPHMILSERIHKLALELVGDETNPVLQASKIYNWISGKFPWAGAREYSTLANIPEYVLLNNHGDCGQVALLYISLVRSLGIPARWESGWMIHPHEVNWHDWAETYFEGVGWVPTDPSFGRGVFGTPMNDYFATGIDVYRMASNEGVGDKLSPPKKFIRSETVDFQPGEVEWKGGNLYYDCWKSHLTVNSITPIR